MKRLEKQLRKQDKTINELIENNLNIILKQVQTQPTSKMLTLSLRIWDIVVDKSEVIGMTLMEYAKELSLLTENYIEDQGNRNTCILKGYPR